ncbi:MAG: N-acetylmuramoyl-L-alanine amidase [Syntrophaceae bacterium]|jgi:N-acetylmuramoyl-L-alanine amidase|nr:N-acetylmuramoyl-L-alanine amidase [Syntrophaceae bacterium]HOC59059.1 N-acetylmuramoyl-L-alanine amidase [Smithellaceae bacterium]HQM44274.1 N-acetylmuramoyl-L-alanine amidase [Smithellaceae bacterium]
MFRQKVNILWQLWAYLVILIVGTGPSECFAVTEISNVRYWTAPDQTRIVFDLSKEPDYQFQIKENEIRLVFFNASLSPSLPVEKKIRKPGVHKILFKSTEDHTCKIKIILSGHSTAEVFKLKKFMEKPDRVVVDIVPEEAEMKKTSREQKPATRKKRIIVVDPGHGGEDPGAIGKNGTYEKDVVLAISREIKKSIDKIPGYQALLTRDGDYYVAFSKRLNMAKQKNASLFISVHADAARNRLARGSSVYCLSTGAASNEAAKLLAKNENLSDIIGGVPDGEGNNQSDEIILNMFQTNTINLSKLYAVDLINYVGRIQCLKYPVFQEAPFRVLKLLDIPAVLLETAYLSNAEEEKLLKKNSFRKTLASAVASSVVSYFSTASSSNSATDLVDAKGDATHEQEKPAAARPVKTISYQVKKGETLNKIAKQHSTSLIVLLKLNRMKMDDSLYVGRKILIPVAETDTTDAKPLKEYIVKKGDTLFALAKNNAVTIDELRRLNHMSQDDVLCSGQKIKLPQ